MIALPSSLFTLQFIVPFLTNTMFTWLKNCYSLFYSQTTNKTLRMGSDHESTLLTFSLWEGPDYQCCRTRVSPPVRILETSWLNPLQTSASSHSSRAHTPLEMKKRTYWSAYNEDLFASCWPSVGGLNLEDWSATPQNAETPVSCRSWFHSAKKEKRK